MTLDLARHTATVAGQPVELTPTEFALLRAMVEQPSRAFSRMELLDAVQGEAYEGYERTIATHIKNLRVKVETDLFWKIMTAFVIVLAVGVGGITLMAERTTTSEFQHYMFGGGNGPEQFVTPLADYCAQTGSWDAVQNLVGSGGMMGRRGMGRGASRVMSNGDDETALPSFSITLAISACAPEAKDAGNPRLHLPPEPAVTSPSNLSLSKTCSLLPGGPGPVTSPRLPNVSAAPGAG